MPISELEITFRLLLSILFSGIIGLERESLNRPAGFRTHILLCVGSTLTMLVSLYIFEQFKTQANLDPARMPAQVVSGIGFLCAGTIIREGATVRGLTTAAGLWAVGAIGLAVGSGFYLTALLSTILIFFTLLSFSKIEMYISKNKRVRQFTIVIDDRPGQIGRIGTVLGEMNIDIKNLKMQSMEDDRVIITLLIKAPSSAVINEALTTLLKIDGIYDIENNP